MATFQRHVELEGSIGEDGTRRFVHPADVRGRFTRLRWIMFAALVALWILLPSVQVGGHPAVFLDVPARRFFLFGETFNAQDVWLVFFLVSGAGFALIALTTVLGRVWCGYACPQTVFLEGAYRRIERWIEGPRERRVARDRGPWTADKVVRKTAKQVAFAVLSVLVAHIILGYFTSLGGLWVMMRRAPAEHPEAFAWMTGIAILTHANFAWFREQICLIVCPYGRLQSVLTDDDSIVIGYDARRGEPRGKATAKGRGDCVDCKRCLVVCPTAIDIRRGLQLECVGCAACIDACDEIMDRLHRPRGLIRYDSLRGLSGERRRFLRPRLWLYVLLGAAGLVAAGFAFSGRASFEANLLRARSAPFTVESGAVRNTFDLHLVNKSPDAADFTIRPRTGGGQVLILAFRQVRLASLESTHVPVVVDVPVARFTAGLEVRLEITMTSGETERRFVHMPLLGPHRRTP